MNNNAEKLNISPVLIKRFIVLAIVLPLIYLAFFIVTKVRQGNEIMRNNPIGNVLIDPNNHAIDTALSRITDKPDFDQLLELGTAYINNNQPMKAVEALNKAIAINPNSPMAFYYTGLAYSSLQNWDSCIFYMNKSIALKPDFKLSLYNKELAEHKKRGDYDWD